MKKINETTYNQSTYPTEVENLIIEHLDKTDKLIFSWGRDTSTFWLARRCTSMCIVEHDLASFNITRDFLSFKNINNIKIKYSKENYVDSIKEYPSNIFDTIIIDEHEKEKCFVHAISEARSGGIIIAPYLNIDLLEEYSNRVKSYSSFSGKGYINEETVIIRKK